MAQRSKGKSVEGTVIDADAALIQQIPEMLQTRDEGLTVREFIAGLVPFFQQARALELKAKARLEAARQLTMPASQEDDTAVQMFIRASSAEKKVVEDHWTITALLFNFQRRLVAVRKRATDCHDEAERIAQSLHNQYKAAEQRRVDEENRRRLREAEEKARADREREQAELERQALELEAKSKELSDREQKFVELYCGEGTTAAGVKGDARQAAARAGYKNPAEQGAILIGREKILAAIRAKESAKALREQAAARREEPVFAEEVPLEKPRIGGGGVDRTTKSGEILDERAFVDAVCEGRHGIPRDILIIDPARLNQYARDMGELINRWPGVRLKRNTKTI